METIGYEAAYNELKQILESIQNPECSIDELKEKIVRARELVVICRNNLRDIQNELEIDIEI